jgi:signal transduction histidine kinase
VSLWQAYKSLLLVLVIIGAAVAFAIASYLHSSSVIDQITFVASNDARSNANIQAYDLAALLSQQLKHVDDNLQEISGSRVVESGNASQSSHLFESSQSSTSQITDVYTWFDRDGKVYWASNFGNVSNYKKFVGLDLSYRDYFKVPRDTQAPYYSSYYLGIDGAPRINIAYPIIFDTNGVRDFKGVVTSSVSLKELGKFVQSQLAGNYQSQVGLLDSNGVVLYSSSIPQYVGKNIFGQEVQSIIPQEIRQPFDKIVRDSLSGMAGSGDFGTQNSTSTIAYSPVTVNHNTVAMLYILTPHQLAGNVVSLIEQQRTFNLYILAAIAVIAAVLAAIIVTWNKRLATTVDVQTSQLKSYSRSLEESNRKLQDSNKLLADANEQLLVHDKMQREFVNIAAHELRTPIQPILVASELMNDSLKESESIMITRPEVDLIVRNAKRLERLSSEILEVARIESGSLKLHKQTFSLDEAISAAVKDATSSPNFSPKVKVIYSPTDIMIYADKDMITQVISNLLRNAAKFTKEGSISVTASKKDAVGAQVVVADTGAGIDPSILPRLFQKFVTGSDQGTGIGLYICKSIVEAHGGTIYGQNRVDRQGAEFAFTVPVAPDQDLPPSDGIKQA